ncbi:MAG: glycosyltransferase family 2 protein [Candidatus Micrarchaeia archaeon]
MKLLITIPAFNEEKTIAKVIQEIPKEIRGLKEVKILVIDDGSTDKTAEIAKRAGADYILVHKRNLGLAKTFKDGLDFALAIGADIIVNIDADAQYNAKEIPKLIEPILKGEADIVLGNRQIDKLDHMPRGKKIGNKIATWVTRKFSGMDIKDAQTGFRAFSREAVMKLNVLGDYTYTQETIIQAVKKGLKIVEVPVEFRKREDNSRLISSIWSYAKKAGIIIIRTYRDYHPFKVFTAIGGIVFLAGVILALRVLFHYLETGYVTPHLPTAVLSVMLIVVGSITMVFALLADMLKTQRELLEDAIYRIKKLEKERSLK